MALVIRLRALGGTGQESGLHPQAGGGVRTTVTVTVTQGSHPGCCRHNGGHLLCSVLESSVLKCCTADNAPSENPPHPQTLGCCEVHSHSLHLSSGGGTWVAAHPTGGLSPLPLSSRTPRLCEGN